MQVESPGITDSNGVRQVDYSQRLAVGYQWYQAWRIEPQFAFGSGLSCSRFTYSGITVSAPNGHLTAEVQVGVTIRTTSRTAGTVQPPVYVTLPARTGEPGGRLMAYKPVAIAAGKSARVTFVTDAAGSDHPSPPGPRPQTGGGSTAAPVACRSGPTRRP